MKNSGKKIVLIILAVLLVIAIGIQLVPVERTNPPAPAPLQVQGAVAEVLRTSCYDCHSNETVWPWYAYVAPVSWLVAGDVVEARKKMNFSEWENMSSGKKSHMAREMMDEIEEGGMPLPKYLRMHPGARLEQEEIELIEEWTDTVRSVEMEVSDELAGEPEEEGHEHEEGDSD